MRSNNETTLKQALHAMLQYYRLKGGYHETRIRELWPQLFGRTVADYTRELRIVKRVLFVSVDSAPLRHDLSHNRQQICERLNTELGENYLQEVVVR